jgi:nickel/cobalt exporter
VEPGEETAVRTGTPTGDPTDGLRRYPRDLLNSPYDRRSATFAVEPGAGTLMAPEAEGEEAVVTRDTSGQGFAAVFEDAAAGEGVLLILLLAAFGWGALHALSPGHGKAMVAAYLIGTRGTARHAVWLGVTVTITHTVGVFALGLVTLLLSQYVLPEDLYPWLTLVSGLLVVAIGAGVLRARLRWAPDDDARDHAHHHGVHHHHDHGDHHRDPNAGHHHHVPQEITRRNLIGMGAAAGLIPCPSALVVLLGAIAQHEVALGLLLIVAFSVGLAGTLTGLGLAVVYARRVLPRLQVGGRLVAALPAASALVIVVVGCLLTAQAVPDLV